MPVTIGIASTGRDAVLHETIHHLAGLKDLPDRLVISIADPDDLDRAQIPVTPFPVTVLESPKGSSIQRNAILDAETDAGIILFLDDDFLIAEGYVAALRQLFAAHGDVVIATGDVLFDGLRGPGIDVAEGRRILQSATPAPAGPQPQTVYSAYGCNMAVRGSTVTGAAIRFDATLPLYGWLEDLDFSRRVGAHGRIVEDANLRGVHLATKLGRSSGRRLGYSQIANPIYLARKGTMDWAPALKLMGGNILANVVKSLRPEPWIDRRGRLRGNLRALGDVLRGRSSPTRVLDL